MPGPDTTNASPRAPNIARSAAIVTAGIVLSRIFGLLRQRVIAHYFGTSAYADVLAAAFRVGNITQNLLGEGTLSASFIPVYARLRGEGKIQQATRFALSALGMLLATAAVASLLGAACAPWLSFLIAAGFDPQKLEATTRIVRIVFPMTGILVLSAWGLGVLNAHRHFFLPYAAPVAWNIAQIAGLLMFGAWFGWHGEGLAQVLAWSALVGAVLQLSLLLPAAKALLGGLRPRWDLHDPHLREASAKLPGALLGRGIIQVSGVVDTLLVSFLGTGANAAFTYAQTLYLLPMSLLGTGEAAAALPEMARNTADQDVERRNAALQKSLGASLGRICTLTVPATLALALLGHELVTLLLQTGSFDKKATAQVVPLLMAYAFALLGNASGRVLSTMLFALGNTNIPARYAFYRVALSTALALILMRSLDVLGVVLGAVIAGWLEAMLLGYRVRRILGGLGLGQIRVVRIALLGVASIGSSLALRALLPQNFAATPYGAFVVLAAFGAGFSIAAPLLGLFSIRSLLRR